MKSQATRKGATVSLPKYVNAEMLTFEFFAGQDVVMNSTPHLSRTVITFSYSDGHMPDKTLDQLLDYVNANI